MTDAVHDVGADAASDPRSRLAAAVRDFGHTSLARELDDDTLMGMASDIEALTQAAAARPMRERDMERLRAQFFPTGLRDGDVVDHFEDCFVSGPHNPLGIGLRARVDGDEVVLWVTLDRGHEGAPERAHGGVLAAVFDDVLGYLMSTHGIAAFTGELSVRYLAPTPIGRRLDLRSRIVERDGRKVWTEATAHDGEQLIATAIGLFIEVGQERFRTP